MASQAVLICEDVFLDQRESMVALQEIGVARAQVVSTVSAALELLHAVERGEKSDFSLILLDLQLGMESGFEILRLWKSSPQLQKVPVVVWTGIHEPTHHDICKFFGVDSYVAKQDGRRALQDAVKMAISRKQ